MVQKPFLMVAIAAVGAVGPSSAIDRSSPPPGERSTPHAVKAADAPARAYVAQSQVRRTGVMDYLGGLHPPIGPSDVAAPDGDRSSFDHESDLMLSLIALRETASNEEPVLFSRDATWPAQVSINVPRTNLTREAWLSWHIGAQRSTPVDNAGSSKPGARHASEALSQLQLEAVPGPGAMASVLAALVIRGRARRRSS